MNRCVAMKDPNIFTLHLSDNAAVEIGGDGVYVCAGDDSVVLTWDEAENLHAWLGEQLQRYNHGPV